ncbi:hypothetical protein GCM10010425_67790 [Streptomyces spororaveus]|uniref:Uncharacterized protein n=1 Tax=Streptomyces spororaveus TaxID=284039 RepID=A0ABQ3TLL4_9ACTN|nr:hypothetical protein Sspor_68790 [Streptomyces spororaveus]
MGYSSSATGRSAGMANLLGQLRVAARANMTVRQKPAPRPPFWHALTPRRTVPSPPKAGGGAGRGRGRAGGTGWCGGGTGAKPGDRDRTVRRGHRGRKPDGRDRTVRQKHRGRKQSG